MTTQHESDTPRTIKYRLHDMEQRTLVEVGKDGRGRSIALFAGEDDATAVLAALREKDTLERELTAARQLSEAYLAQVRGLEVENAALLEQVGKLREGLVCIAESCGYMNREEMIDHARAILARATTP